MEIPDKKNFDASLVGASLRNPAPAAPCEKEQEVHVDES